MVAAFDWTKKAGIQVLPSLIPNGDTVAFGINNFGTIVGNADSASGSTHPVLWPWNGTPQDLGTLAGGFGTAFGLNNNKLVVGYSTTASGDPHAFIWSADNGIEDLNDLIDPSSGWVLVWASAINDAGEITGWGTINGENHAYLLSR
jgi:probable HAF family extracellular repeat protein